MGLSSSERIIQGMSKVVESWRTQRCDDKRTKGKNILFNSTHSLRWLFFRTILYIAYSNVDMLLLTGGNYWCQGTRMENFWRGNSRKVWKNVQINSWSHQIGKFVKTSQGVWGHCSKRKWKATWTLVGKHTDKQIYNSFTSSFMKLTKTIFLFNS